MVEVILHTITTTINTFGQLSSSEISSCYSLFEMTFSTPEMPILKIAIVVKGFKWFAFELFTLSDKGFSHLAKIFLLWLSCSFTTFGKVWQRVWKSFLFVCFVFFYFFFFENLFRKKKSLKTKKYDFVQLRNVGNHFWSQRNLTQFFKNDLKIIKREC